MHYTRWRRHGNPEICKLQRGETPVVDLLPWDRIEVTETCWLWTGTRTTVGYGKFRGTGAHRVVYTALVGPIASGLDLDHICRVRHCVRPEHLEPVTHGENIRRGWEARRNP